MRKRTEPAVVRIAEFYRKEWVYAISQRNKNGYSPHEQPWYDALNALKQFGAIEDFCTEYITHNKCLKYQEKKP